MNAIASPSSSRRQALLILSCCLLVFSISARADDWLQWRGPTNNGLCNEKNLPTKWSEKENVAWKFALPGEGSSTPVVVGERIFLSCEDGKDIVALCISTAGKELWKQKLGSARKSGRGDEGNCASPSPSSDGKHVYFFCGNGECAAFDLDGKEAWRFNAEERYKKFRIAFGIHSTPVLHGDHLYLQLMHDGASLIVCVDKNTGKEVWKHDRISDGTAENKHVYTSPFLWTNGKDAYLVVHGNDYTTAHSLKDGKELWRVADLNPKGPRYRGDLRFVASPVCTPDLIVIPTAKNKAFLALRPDANGKIGADEKKFQLWRHEAGTTDVPSPLIHDGLLYLVGESGWLACLDAKTGAQNYRKMGVEGGRHRASPVLADGKIYMTSRAGVTSVVKAGKEFEKLASNKLPDEIAASLAIANGRIYLRGYKYLWAIGQETKGAAK